MPAVLIDQRGLVYSAARLGAMKPSLYEPRSISHRTGRQLAPIFGLVTSPKSL